MPDAPLTGLRVLERTQRLAGGYAGFLLAGLGAAVVRVEPPTTEVASPGDRVLARGKRSVVLTDETTWPRLVARADAVLVDEAVPELPDDPTRLSCRVTTWGSAGPRRHLPADDALVAAATGLCATQRSWSGDPVWLVTPLASYMTGALAALGIAAAAYARMRGTGGQRIAVSLCHGAVALNSGTYVSGPGHAGRLTAHGTPRGPYPNYAVYETSDGWVLVGALTQAFFVKLLTVVERLDLLAHPELAENPLAFSGRDYAIVREALEPIFRTRTTAAWVEALAAADIPSGPVQRRADCLRDPGARALGLVVAVDDAVLGPSWQVAGPPATFSLTPAPPLGAPPARGADTEAMPAVAHDAPGTPVEQRPRACLEGIRVLDLTSFIAGPLCPVLLADLGADVVKIETAEGDPFRLAVYGFVGWNRGKRSLVLDLKRPEGRALFLRLAARADVVVDNFRPGVMERLGIGWETLAATNPRLIHTAISGYGPHDPLPGFDPVFQARAGLMQAQGGDDEPVFHSIAYSDYSAGTLAALATVAALVARERTGRGQRVDVSLFRAALTAQAAEMVLATGAEPDIPGGRDFRGPRAARRLYACAGGWVCVAARSDAEAAALGTLAGTALAVDDPPDGDRAATVAACLAVWTRASALERLAAAGVPAVPVVSYDELFDDPHLRANDCLVIVDDAKLGAVTQCGPVIDLAATPIPLPRSAPPLGAHGAAVLREAGLTEAEIAALVASAVVGAPRA